MELASIVRIVHHSVMKWHSIQDKTQAQDLDGLANSLEQIIFHINLCQSWTYLNIAWQNLSGFSVEESLDTCYLNYVHPRDREKCRTYFDGYLNGLSKQGSMAFRCLMKNGNFRWVETYANPLSDTTGTVTGVAGTLTDITRRVHKEGLLLANHRTLSRLIDNLPGMVYRGQNNRDLTMDYVSAGSLELTGYHPADLIDSKTLSYASLIHEEDQEMVWSEIQQALGEQGLFELEYRIRCADKTEKWVWDYGKGIFSTSGELLALEGFIIDITKDKKAGERLWRDSLYSPLTGLITPKLFEQHLERALIQARASGHYNFAVLLVHIDNLAKIEKKFGLEFKDHIIMMISQRLQEIVAPCDVLSNWREDQFAILLAHGEEIQKLTGMARRIQEQLLAPIRHHDTETYVTASVGITLSDSNYSSNKDIIRDAETALQRARTLGGARYEIFDLRVHAKAAAISQLEDDLQQALAQGQCSVYWQPIIAIVNARIVGLEARLVWFHPRLGSLFANQFVPIAEKTQLIKPLWEWMIIRICEQMVSWKQHPWSKTAAIKIQISSNSLLDADFILHLSEKLLKAKPAAFDLALGITEAALLETPQGVNVLLQRLKGKRIQLVLDSFGGGASSLSMLKDMPIDHIRLDHNLIENSAREEKYIAAIIDLGHALDISVIANGVTTEEQLALLKKLGCDYALGDIVSPPVDAASITQMFAGDYTRI